MYINEPFEPKIYERYFQDVSHLETLKHPICIFGVPDLTNLGKNCTEYLIKELNTKKIVTYYFSDFEPISYVENGNQIAELICIEFHIIKNLQNKNDFIIITGKGIPKSPIGINFLADKIAEFVSSFNPQLFISFATIPLSYQSQSPRTFLAHTSKELLQIFKINTKTQQNQLLKLQTLKKGVVIGLNGLTVAYAKTLYNIPGGILLSEAVEHKKTDYFAVKAILEILNIIFNLELSFESLNLEIKQSSKNYLKMAPTEDDYLKNIRKKIQN